MIIFLFGKNSYLSKRKLIEYKERYHKKYGSRGDLSDYDCEEKKDIDWKASLISSSLFSPTRLVIYRKTLQFLSQEKQKDVCEILKNHEKIVNEKEVVVIFWEEEIPKKNSPLYDFLLKKAVCQEFKELSENKLLIKAEKFLFKLNPKITIKKPVLEKLITFTGNNLEKIVNELVKISNYKETGEINSEDIDNLVIASLSSTVFQTIEAACTKNKRKSLKLFHEQIENRIEPLYILSMYINQFRNLLRIKECFCQGMKSKFDISKKTGIHLFAIEKTIPYVGNFSEVDLKKIFSNLQKIDHEIKTGKVEIKMALDVFLMRI